MSHTATLEQRIDTLEQEVSQLKEKLEGTNGSANGTITDSLALPLPSTIAVGLPSETEPLSAWSGWLRNDPMLEAWKQAMEDYRRAADEAEGLP